MNLLQAKNILWGMEGLNKNWDGQEAEAPNKTALENADLALSFMFPKVPFKVSPSVEGGVGMSWEGNSELKVYIECANEGSIMGCFYGPDIDYDTFDASELGIIPFTNRLKEALNG